VGRFVLPKVDDPVEIVFVDVVFLHEMPEFSNVTAHELLTFELRLHRYYGRIILFNIPNHTHTVLENQ
jgi:hypothetical protein